MARNLVLHLLYSFINKGVAKEECGNPGPACLLQYLTSLPDSPAVSGGKEPFPIFQCRSLIILLYAVFIRRSRKEVFQPHLPVRLPCYDLAPITSFTLGRSTRLRTSGTPGFHGLTGGVYKARERIHRAMADARLLANPASWGRVADPSPN